MKTIRCHITLKILHYLLYKVDFQYPEHELKIEAVELCRTDKEWLIIYVSVNDDFDDHFTSILISFGRLIERTYNDFYKCDYFSETFSDTMISIIKNDNVVAEAAEQPQKEKKLYPLKITSTTWILVPLSKRTEEYAEKYRKEKMGIK